MNKILYITLILLNLNLLSCKQKESNRSPVENSNQSLDSIKNTESLSFEEEKLNCKGEQYSSSSCSDTNKQVSILFNDSSVSFLLNHKNFNFNLENSFGQLGYKTSLFINDKDKIIIIDEFLEFNHLYYMFYINSNNDIYFLGKKEINVNDEVDVVNLKVKKNSNLITVSLNDKIENINFELSNLKNKLSPTPPLVTTPSDLKGMWGVICANELTELDINKDKGFLSLYSINAIYINLKVEKISNKNEYLLRYASVSSQQDYYADKLKIVDEDIDKNKPIGTLILLEDGKARLEWIGLYNLKKQKLEFVGKDFLFISENGGRLPLILERCVSET